MLKSVEHWRNTSTQSHSITVLPPRHKFDLMPWGWQKLGTNHFGLILCIINANFISVLVSPEGLVGPGKDAVCPNLSRFPDQDCSDLTYLLNERELSEVHNYTDLYKQKFNVDPATDPNAMFFLGDNTRYSVTWSSTSGAIPTFRRVDGKFWIPFRKRWLVASEKMAALGFPVTTEVAHALGLKEPLPSMDASRGVSVCGNSFHFANSAVVMLLAVSCFGPALWAPEPRQYRR